MTRKPIFDAVRKMLGRGFTQEEVIALDAAIDVAEGKATLGQPAAPVDQILVDQLKIDEGLRLKAYQDTVGVWTIGYGHTLKARPGLVWTREQAEDQLKQDVLEHNAKLAAALPWVNQLDPVRRRVLQNMAFNLGIGTPGGSKGLLGFRNTLEFVRTGQYDKAADGMLTSKWARQVKDRADRLAKQMRTGRQ